MFVWADQVRAECSGLAAWFLRLLIRANLIGLESSCPRPCLCGSASETTASGATRKYTSSSTTARCPRWALVTPGFKLPLRLATSKEKPRQGWGHGGRSAAAGCRLAPRATTGSQLRQPNPRRPLAASLGLLSGTCQCADDPFYPTAQAGSRTGSKHASFARIRVPRPPSFKFRRRRPGARAIHLSWPTSTRSQLSCGLSLGRLGLASLNMR